MPRNQKRMVVVSPLTPGKGGKFTGETVQWGGTEKLVYRELKPEHDRTKQQIVIGLDGAAVFHPAPPGSQRIPMRERVETIPTEKEGERNPDAYREYILEDSGHGVVHKVFGFREDPEVVKRLAREAARKEKRDRLLDVLLDEDIEPEEMVQTIRGRQTRAEGTAIQIPHKLHKGFGKWEVWDGETMVAEKLTKDEAIKRVEELTRLKQGTTAESVAG